MKITIQIYSNSNIFRHKLPARITPLCQGVGRKQNKQLIFLIPQIQTSFLSLAGLKIWKVLIKPSVSLNMSSILITDHLKLQCSEKAATSSMFQPVGYTLVRVSLRKNSKEVFIHCERR